MKPQCTRLLGALAEHPMTTREIEDRLGIGRPGARVSELREAGHDIETKLVMRKNRLGEEVRVAQYILHAATDQKVAA